jgi:nucleotide-binding universal stress UspA family protein
VSSKASADGWNEPTNNLPPLEVRELPEPMPLGKLVGASVILLATALGPSGLLIWPYITTQAGVGLLWLATLGFLSQYFLNMEIERYTLAQEGVSVAEAHLVRGRPDREVVHLSEEIGAGLIILGSRGLGGVRRALMGSVSDSVVRHAHCPVMIVRE